MKKLKISKMILYFLCVAAAALIFFLYLAIPNFQKINDLTGEHNDNTAQISYYNDKISNQRSLETKIEFSKKELEYSQKMPGIDPLKIGEDLNESLKSTGVEVTGITVDDKVIVESAKKTTAKQSLVSVPIKVEINCTPEQADTLLGDYEQHSEAAYYVNSVTLDAADKEQTSATTDSKGHTVQTAAVDTNMYKTTLDITMYYYASKEETASIKTSSENSGKS